MPKSNFISKKMFLNSIPAPMQLGCPIMAPIMCPGAHGSALINAHATIWFPGPCSWHAHLQPHLIFDDKSILERQMGFVTYIPHLLCLKLNGTLKS